MKRLTLVSIVLSAVLLNISGRAVAEDTAAAPQKPAESGTLSDQDIAALKQTFTDAQTKKSWIWQGAFTQKQLSPADAAKAKSLQKIPFRITGALYQVIEVSGKKTNKRESGTSWMYVKDAEGKIVSKTSQPLDKMCPS